MSSFSINKMDEEKPILEKLSNKIHTGDCLKFMKRLPAKSIDFCITSPPYWKMRDYGFKEQIGQEKTPEEYIRNLLAVFRELKRILKDTGSFWEKGDRQIGEKGDRQIVILSGNPPFFYS